MTYHAVNLPYYSTYGTGTNPTYYNIPIPINAPRDMIDFSSSFTTIVGLDDEDMKPIVLRQILGPNQQEFLVWRVPTTYNKALFEKWLAAAFPHRWRVGYGESEPYQILEWKEAPIQQKWSYLWAQQFSPAPLPFPTNFILQSAGKLYQLTSLSQFDLEASGWWTREDAPGVYTYARRLEDLLSP